MLIVAVSSTWSCQRRSARQSGPLEMVVPNEIATLDPRFSTRGLDIKVTRLVHAGLVGLDPETLKPVPYVAEAWSFESPRELRVTLRPGIRFHSGQPLGPTDVCATIAALKDPGLGSPHRAVVRAIGSCRVEGARQLAITLSRPRATLLTDLEVPILRADQARSPPRPNGGLDGLGPYRIQTARPGEVRLAPAATGVLPEPEHHAVIRTVRDENARALRLLAGRADIAPNAISPALLPALEHEPDLWVNSRPGANVTYLLLHNERAPFDRIEARRAAAHAIDRQLIVDTLLAGQAEVASWIFPEGHWSYPGGHQAEPLPPIAFDPTRARLAFESAPPVTLLTSTDRSRVTIARAVAQMLGDAGLEVRVAPLDLGVMLDRLDAGDFEMAILQMPELTEPNILHWFFHPEGVPGEGGQGRNRTRWRSATAGQLLDVGATASEHTVRQRAYHRLARLMAAELPVLPLWHENQVAIVSPRAQHFTLSAEGRWLDLARR